MIVPAKHHERVYNLQPKIEISVIIASYNIKTYINKAISSVLAQEGGDFEIIVVDDCSNDGTLDEITNIQDPRLRVFKMERNSGPGAARNKAISESKGKWIAIFDGDDEMAPGRLARMLSIAQMQNVDAVVDNLEVHCESNGKIFPMFPVDKFRALGELKLATFMKAKLSIWKGYPLGYLKPLYSRRFLEVHNIAYHEDIRIGEDYLFMAEFLASGGKCAIDPTCGYKYTGRIGSTSHRMTTSDMDTILEHEDKFFERFSLSSADRKAHKSRQWGICEYRAYIAAVEAIKRRSPGEFLESIISYPTSIRFFWEPIWNRISKLFP